MDKQKSFNLHFKQAKDLIWIIDKNFELIEANPAFMNEKGNHKDSENKICKPFLVEFENNAYKDNWKLYYEKAIQKKYFEFVKHFYHPITKVEQHCIVTISPFFDKNNTIEALTCQLKDISHLDKLKPEANILKNNFLDVFCTINEKGSFVFVSETATSLWGYTPTELKYIPYRSLIVEEDIEKTDKIAEEIINGAEVTTFTNRYIRKDGGIAYNNWSARWDNELKLMFCIARNGKEQTEKEQAILQSEQRFKSLVQEGGDMISIIDLEGNYTYTSPTTTSILGITPEEFQGNNIADFIHPDDIEKTGKYLERITTEKKIIVEPFRLRDSNNNWRWIESVITNMLDNPAVQGIVANSRDITKKINEEHRLKLFESVITNASDIVLISEAEPLGEPGPRIIYVNEAFTKLTGYTAEEVIGKTPRILQGPNTDYEELAKLGKALRNWESYEVTTINYKKNGEEFWINFKVTPVADENGWFTHWIAIERDVTEQVNKTLENKLTANISEAFTQNNNLEQSAEVLLEKMAEFGQFDFLELWLPNLTNKKTNLYSYKLKEHTDEIFYTISNKNSNSNNRESLHAKVLQSKKNLCIDDINSSSLFKRKKAAKKIGLKSILGLPLLHQNEIEGVLLIGSKSSSNLLKKNKPILEKLEHFIGSEIHRKKLENNLKLLFDTIPEIISTGDFEGNFLKINEAGCKILGYKEHEIVGASFEKFMHPADIEKSRNEMASLASGQETFNFETRFITKKNKIVWLSWNCTPDFKNEVIYSTAKDITEEIKLKELTREAGEIARIGSWELDLENNSLFWSDMVHQIHETDPKTFAPKMEDAIKFYREDFQNTIKKSIENCIANNVEEDIEAVIVTANNKEIWVRAQGKPEFIDGKCTRVYGSLQDINDRKETELRLNDFAENLPGVVFQYVIDADGKDHLQYISKGAIDTWGLSVTEAMQNNQLIWERIALGGDLEKVQKSIENSITTKTRWSSQWKYIMPNGEKRIHLGYGKPNYMTNGSVVFNSIILDITQDARNEQLLNEVSTIAKIGSWELNLEKKELFWSDQVHKIHGTDPTSYKPDLESAANFYRADFKDLVKKEINKAIATGESWDFEAVIITKQNQEKWVRAIGSPEVIDGNCIRLYGSFQDINSIKNTENRLKDISDNLPGVVYQYVLYPDGTDTLTYLSGAVEEIWGFTPNEALADISLVWKQIELAGDLKTARESIFKAIETKTKWNGRFRYMKPNGEVRMHIGNGTPTFLSDGTIIFNSIIIDITKENKNEVLLKQASEVARIGSWEMDLINVKNKKMFWSPMVYNILELPEYHPTELTNFIALFEKESKLRIEKAIQELIDNGNEFDEEVLVNTKNGNQKWVRCIGDIEVANNTPLKIFGSFQDIHQSKLLDLRLSDILNSISDAFYAIDKHWNFTYFNKEAERLLKRNQTEVIDKNIWEAFPEAKESSLPERYERIMKTKVSETFEYLFPGDEIWYEISVYPSLEGLSVYFKSIDERKKAEQKLLQAFEEKNRILESIGDGFFSVKKDWTVTYWNKEAEYLTGIKKEEIVNQNFWNIYEDAIDTPFYFNYKKAMEERIKVTFEEYYPNLNKWFEANAYPSKEGLSVYFKDTTQRKQISLQLEEANDRFQKVTEATKDAIWDWNIEKNTFFRSDAIKHFFGNKTPLELTRETFWQDRFHPEDLVFVKQQINTFIEDSNCETWELEYRVYDENKKIIYIVDRGIITRNSEGKATRMVGSMTDITEQKKLNIKLKNLNKELQVYTKDLERSNSELEQFAFITSHDLQEPLRMVNSFMEQLKRKYGNQLDDKALQYIDFATDGAKRMKQIILDLLEYSRAGRLTDAKETLSLEEIIAEYKILRRKVIAEKSVLIKHAKLPKLVTQKVVITQIMHSLLDNAIKYSKNGVAPQIEISAKEKEKEWLVSVKDNGIGIDSKFFDKIFVIFQRLHNRSEYDGTGIGLSVTKKHIESLGGKIWLTSIEGTGTTFYFTILK